MIDTITKGQADFVLAPFSNAADLVIRVNDLRLVPIPSVRVMINESGHVLVNKMHPEGVAIYQALNKGLVILKQQDKINKVLTQSGFYNPELADWSILNTVK
ncbi:hypothetical protein [Algibacillus agarilyticus]|uniref:hypothetical protein n=1 Tax=Algibacillus agarilyticus TaxID=2234133 RepID=UPI000DD06F48|nr:hypothetical protein [Algibacillus agarilyticus]